MTTRDENHVICPHCGAEHGDAWEWCTSEMPFDTTCDECGKVFEAWVVYDVSYCAHAKAPAGRDGSSSMRGDDL